METDLVPDISTSLQTISSEAYPAERKILFEEQEYTTTITTTAAAAADDYYY
jgi:hypothetical protein